MDIRLNGHKREIDHIVPPSRHFPYWALYYSVDDNTECCEMITMEEVRVLKMFGPKPQREVTEDGTISQSEMSNVLDFARGEQR